MPLSAWVALTTSLTSLFNDPLPAAAKFSKRKLISFPALVAHISCTSWWPGTQTYMSVTLWAFLHTCMCKHTGTRMETKKSVKAKNNLYQSRSGSSFTSQYRARPPSTGSLARGSALQSLPDLLHSHEVCFAHTGFSSVNILASAMVGVCLKWMNVSIILVRHTLHDLPQPLGLILEKNIPQL